ncbi:lantibiotic dehydratase family protein [Marinifilum fragile]|uniref:lantibiotic dehydratase family protein n=1 Tax=Marinifilum fragile TaxID=570161 RepID=UPI002AA73B81|nr:lantibiotic dehydratase family protein [Marinifilum fragile]
MKKFSYKSFDNFVLRVPLLSLDYVQSIFANKNTSDEDLKKIYENSIIQEAIFLASPSLHSKLAKWLNNELSSAKDIELLKQSLTKYLLRMGSRCTPFGLFAGYGLGKIGDINKIELDDDQKYYAHLRLDMNYLCALAIDLSKIKEIKEQIRFFPNTSIYKSGNKLRYVEYRYNNSKRNHFIVAVEDSEYLQKVFNASKKGAQIKDLTNILVDDEISFDEAKSFIEELIDSQLLISELEPSVTGAEFLDQIIGILKPLKNIENIIDLLHQFDNDIVNIRNKAIGISANIYKKITEKLSTLETKYDIKYLFQTDLVISAKEIKLNSDISNDVLKAIELMNKLTPRRVKENLLKFKEAFYERYEEREVPLSQALDVESGVGYIQNTGNGDLNPLVDDIALPVGVLQNSYNIEWDQLQSFLLKKYNQTLSKGLSEIEITDEDVKDFNANWDDLPPTFSAMVEIISSSGDDGDLKISFSSAGGSSAANLLGRFCHSSSDLYDYVTKITETEKDTFQDSVLAEIVHLPESRTGNILLRPQIRDFEIPYLAKSSFSEDYQISIKDIVVSVKNGKKVVLRSKSLNKEIIPRLSNAHNFSHNALPVYQFLCDLQTQDLRANVGFNWGALSNEYSYLPRVNYKNIILSKATWNIKRDEFRNVIEAKGDANIEKEIKLWMKKYNLPDYVLLADGDNELLLQLNNMLCIKTLISLVKKRPKFLLKEFLFDPKDAIAKRGNDSFTNQVVFSFFKSVNN